MFSKELIVEYLTNATMLRSFILSVFIYFLSVLFKGTVTKKITKNKDLSSLDASILKKTISSYINFAFVILLFFVWFSQIQSVLVSLLAVTAAFVIATKEVIMSVMGGLLVRANNHFKLGDRIEINGVRGFVIQKSLTVTKVLELGPEKNSQQTTGDIITIPNGLMLSSTVRNESYFKNYSIKSFTLKNPDHMAFEEFESLVLSWANEISSSYIEEAKKLIEDFCNTEGLLIPTIVPRTKIILGKEREFELLLKMPIPNSKIADIEQQIYRQYLKIVEEKKFSELG